MAHRNAEASVVRERPLDPSQPAGKRTRQTPSAKAAAGPGSRAAPNRDAPSSLQARPPPGNRRKGPNDLLIDAIAIASSGINATVANIVPKVEDICHTVRSVGNSILQQISSLREDMQKQNEDIVKETKKNRTDLQANFEKLSELRVNFLGSSLPETRDAECNNLETKAALMFEVMKFLTCLQFLDKKKGDSLFCNTTTNCDALIEAAKLVNGVEGTDEFLNALIPDKKREKTGSITVASFACRGQGRAHDNIRKSPIKSFEAACPQGHQLNPASNASEAEKRQCAKDLFMNGRFKTNQEYNGAWTSSCRAAVMEAISTATVAASIISEKNESLTLPTIPSPDLSNSEFEMSLYSMGFVSMKLAKYIQATGRAKGARMNKSHNPFWAREVLFLRDALRRMRDDEENICSLNEAPIILRQVTAYHELEANEVGKLRCFIEADI